VLWMTARGEREATIRAKILQLDSKHAGLDDQYDRQLEKGRMYGRGMCQRWRSVTERRFPSRSMEDDGQRVGHSGRVPRQPSAGEASRRPTVLGLKGYPGRSVE
jgi:hypothetical protein